jgi:O-antigen/teichoic acid export membrane protein
MTISKARTFRNILYSGLAKGITLVCVAGTSLVVARNLTPADYGVVGFAGIIIVFLSHFSDMGVSSAVIRRSTLQPHNIDVAITLKIILSAAAFAITLLIAPFAHHIFDHPAIANVIRILALTFLVSIIGFLPTALLTREMNYKALVIPGVATAAAQCILAVILVLHGWRYWGIVIASVGATLAGGMTVQFVKRVPVRLRFDLADMGEYIRYGAPLFGTGVLVFALFNLDNLLIGGYMGSIQLGYYALAFNWGSFICGLLYDTVNNVLFPAFSAIQDDSAAVKRWYLKSVDLVGFLAAVANGTLFANASYFLITLLGKGSDKWVPAIVALRILCAYGIVRAITEPLGSCILARGRTKTMLHANVLAGAVEVMLLLVAVHSKRIELVAVAVLIAYASQSLVYLPFLRRELSITGADVLMKVWPVLPSLTAGWLFTSLLPSSLGKSLPTLVVRCLFTASVIALTHGLFSRFRCFYEAGGLISQNVVRIAGKPRDFGEAQG